MKAAVLTEVGKPLEICEREIPAIEDGDLLARVDLCGICTSDLMALHGEVTDYSPPVVMGHEIAATVVESRNDAIKMGEKFTVNPMITCGNCSYCLRDQCKFCNDVVGFGHDIDGGYAEFMRVPRKAIEQGCLVSSPDHVPPEELIFAEPLGCCLNAWRETEFRDSLVILGAGAIGLMFLKLALRSGIRTAVVEPLRRRQEWARRLGAEHVFGTDDADFDLLVETLSGGADTVIMATNNPEAIEQSFRVARRGAFINFFGLLPKGHHVRVELEEMHFQGYRLAASWAFSHWSMKTACSEISSGKLSFREMLTHVVSIEETNLGMKLVAERTGIKVAVKP